VKPILLLTILIILAPTVQAQNLTAEDRAFITDHMGGVLDRLVQVEQATLRVLERLEAVEAQETQSQKDNKALRDEVKALAEEARTATDAVQAMQTDIATLRLLPDQVADASTGIKTYIRDTVDLDPLRATVAGQDEAIQALHARTTTLLTLNVALALLAAGLAAWLIYQRLPARKPRLEPVTPEQEPAEVSQEKEEEEALAASLALQQEPLGNGWDAPHPAPKTPQPEPEPEPAPVTREPEPVPVMVTVKPKAAPPAQLVGVCGPCFTDSGPCQSEGHCMLGVTAHA
jgi:hypothetical protein